MNLVHHKTLDVSRWYASTISFQMTNIGSEISRTIIWRDKQKPEYADLAFERALELIDLTVTDKKNGGRLRELLRARELLVGWKLAGQAAAGEDRQWTAYFDAFAHAVSLGK